MPIVIAGRLLKAGAAIAAAGLALALPPAAAAPSWTAGAARSAAAPAVGGPPPVSRRAATQAVAWCGHDEIAENRSPELEVSSDSQIRVVYAVPSDRPDRFPSLASPIATDLSAIDQWWQREDPTRTLRFDLYPFAGCGSRFGMLDLGVVRLPGDSASYGDEAGFVRLAIDVARLASGNVKTLAFYDGAHGGGVCGESWTAPFFGGPNGVSIVYLDAPAGCGQDLGTGGSVAVTAVHELTHSLGAVPADAPHACGGHVCDSSADLIWATAQTGETLLGKTLDANRDDYYGHSGAWWDVQDSNWLIHLPQFPLTVAVVGQGGAGTVSSQPEVLSCPSSCSAAWDNGTLVSLVAQPPDGSRLVGWSGDCSGADECDLTMDGAKSVTATFGPSSFKITIAVTGKGRVTSLPKGFSCTGRCMRPFEAATAVRLTATPAKGYRFAGWKGDCAGAKGCRITVDRDHAVRAVFSRR